MLKTKLNKSNSKLKISKDREKSYGACPLQRSYSYRKIENII